MAKIVIAGTLLVDRINEIDRYPRLGELTQVRSVKRVPGGIVPNTGCDLRILDPTIEVVGMGKVGDDDEGRIALAQLRRHGIDTSGVVVSKTLPTSFTEVMSSGGERTFFTYAGACAEFGYDDIRFDLVAPGDIFLLGYFLLLEKVDAGDGERILKELTARGVKTAIDLVSESSDRYRLVVPCLKYVDYLIVNEIEAARLAGLDGSDLRAVAEALLKLGVRERVIIHRPEASVTLTQAGEWTERRSVKLPEGFIKGKTGAGDAFCAGALIGIHRGRSDAEILDLGALAAVGALSAPGAIEGMRPLSELRELIER